ncbi:MAG: hypothetical protein L7U45_05990 [Alphaproteobacteria bacterium]|nr:hypothetical protein [Alphaproteobacteria bacterium]
MQLRVRNAGPWEMKHLQTTLVSSWNPATVDLGDGGTVSKSKQSVSQADA